MKRQTRVIVESVSIGLLLICMGGTEAGQTSSIGKAPIEQKSAVAPSASCAEADAVCKPYQLELLDLAYGAASAIPIDPHVTDRSRAQELVVAACLELDQPSRALKFAEGIVDFRKGAAFADIALWFAQHDDLENAKRYMGVAKILSDSEEDWRQDRIRVKVARAMEWLGQKDNAADLEKNVVDAESGKVAVITAMRAGDATFDSQVAKLDQMISTGNFDLMRNAMDAYCKLYDRYYGDEQRRPMIEEKVRAASAHLPAQVRIEFLCTLGGSAMKHADKAKALQLSQEGEVVFVNRSWMPEDHMAMTSKLAVLRSGAGETKEAAAELDADLVMYDQENEKIISVYRSAALRAIAEAYQMIGETAKALETYRKALEVGAENPNQRPRALDFSAVCTSMATHGVEADASFRARLDAIRAGLGAP